LASGVGVRVRLEAELVAEREHAMLPGTEPGTAGRKHGPVFEHAVPDPSADSIARFEHDDVASGFSKCPRGREAGQACTDHDHIRAKTRHVRFLWNAPD